MKLTKTITLLAVVSCIVLLLAGTGSAGIFDPGYRGADNSVHTLFFWTGNPTGVWDLGIFETGDSDLSSSPLSPNSF